MCAPHDKEKNDPSSSGNHKFAILQCIQHYRLKGTDIASQHIVMGTIV